MNARYFFCRKECPACKSNDFCELYSSPFDKPPISEYLISFYSPQGGVDFECLSGAVYRIFECRDCGLIFQSEVPNDLLMSKLYDEWIDPELSFERHRQSDDLNFFSDYAQEISTIIAHLHRVPADLKVLDFGMGWGKWALMAKGFGCDVFGVELSVERIRYASSSAIACIPWEEIPSHSFDFINTEQVFEHLPNPLDTLIYLKRSLKGNGLLKISVPTANNIATRLEYMDWSAPKGTKYSLNPVAPLEHINYFRRRSLIKMAEIAGMCEVRIPIRTQYKHTTNWCGVTNTLKKIAKPVYRNILKRENYCLFAAK